MGPLWPGVWSVMLYVSDVFCRGGAFDQIASGSGKSPVRRLWLWRGDALRTEGNQNNPANRRPDSYLRAMNRAPGQKRSNVYQRWDVLARGVLSREAWAKRNGR